MKKTLLLSLILTALVCIGILSSCGEKTTENNPDYETELTPSEGLEFENNDEFRICSVSGIGTCTDSDIVIPRSQNGYDVVNINQDAFFRNQTITSVIIQDGVNYIGKSAFAVCKELKSVTIPQSLKDIGSDAFFNCIKMETIIYKGTKEQWSFITLNSNWDAGLGNYTIICTDGEITKVGS